ncbi:hypothetical protein [uncultured Psychroserpens sp.]|uniref:hypothetical protein n=1 Tax=uncultured Psychroserpens sp. TaxID=255436 RepID=UPI00262D734F|nr:hypothetical protein [uncultured Psychroserpens sp.]
MHKLSLFFCLSLFIHSYCFAQIAKDSTKTKQNISNSGFKEYYPIHEKPSIMWSSNLVSFEPIFFEAKPTVYYSISNNMRYVMQNFAHKPSDAFYFTFQPHIRMYDEQSVPVKMPSYKVLAGWQRLVKTPRNNFFSFAVESGHFSNGQSGCTFDSTLVDESDACTALHATITDSDNLSELLNRTNGNFSTNLTKLSLNFRVNRFGQNNTPFISHSFSGAYTLFHNRLFGLIDKGGFSDFDIGIYGRHRFELDYEYIHTYAGKFRYSLGINTEFIERPHPSVEPWRVELFITVYPFKINDLAFFVKYNHGHDDYNIRFVDSGNQFSVGAVWDWFKPFEIKRAEVLEN